MAFDTDSMNRVKYEEDKHMALLWLLSINLQFDFQRYEEETINVYFLWQPHKVIVCLGPRLKNNALATLSSA